MVGRTMKNISPDSSYPRGKGLFLSMLALVFCITATASTALAAAWLQPHNHVELIFPITRETATEFRDSSGDSFSGPKFTKWEIKPMVEWGFSDSWTFGVSPGFQFISEDLPTGDQNASGLSGIDVYARTPLHKTKNTILSGQVMVILPGTFDAAAPFPGSAQVSPTTSLEARLLYGIGGLKILPGSFIDLQAAYRFMGGIMADEIRLDATAGMGKKDHYLVMLQLFDTIGMGNADPPAADYDLLKVRLSGVHHVYGNISLQLGIEKAVLGNNTVAGWTLVAAAWVKW